MSAVLYGTSERKGNVNIAHTQTTGYEDIYIYALQTSNIDEHYVTRFEFGGRGPRRVRNGLDSHV